MKAVRPEYYFSTVNPGAAHRRRRQASQVQTIDFVIGVGAHVPDEVVAQFIKAVRENKKDLVEGHPNFNAFQREGDRPSRSRASPTIPAAIKYFKEAGIWQAVVPGQRKGTQACLRPCSSRGRSAWSLDLFRKVGLVLFAEQFAAAAFGIGLALTFLRFRFKKTHVEETGYGGATGPVPWYDWLLFAAALAVCGYLTLHFPAPHRHRQHQQR